MPFPSPIERPGIFSLSGPEKLMNQAANKWKNSLMPQPVTISDADFPPPAFEDHTVRPLPIPAMPENLPVPPTPAELPAAIPAVPLQENAAISESQLASAVPLAKQILKLLQNRRILGGFFFVGLLAMGYFLKNETIRNVNISVEADPHKKRTYRILLDQGNTTIRLELTSGKPVNIQLKRPVTKEPTVYNIVIEVPETAKKQFSEEHIDLGDRQIVRLIDKR
ncbi:MAG: hypothetical protein LLG04_08495 [Parachlamydia sp.]|nr:hypothetical protein [Parachlamydia sp.]